VAETRPISASPSTATATASARSTAPAASCGATSCWRSGRDVLKTRPGGTIIADVKASQVLFDEIARMGGTPLMWKTGHSLIKAKMAETGSPLAGEMSGHIFFADKWYGFDDALYCGLRLRHRGSSQRRAAGGHARPPADSVNTPETALRLRGVAQVRGDRRGQGAAEAEAGAKVNDIDGVRVNTPDGWWLLRASNTQEVLVARAEARRQVGHIQRFGPGQRRRDAIAAPFVGEQDRIRFGQVGMAGPADLAIRRQMEFARLQALPHQPQRAAGVEAVTQRREGHAQAGQDRLGLGMIGHRREERTGPRSHMAGVEHPPRPRPARRLDRGAMQVDPLPDRIGRDDQHLGRAFEGLRQAVGIGKVGLADLHALFDQGRGLPRIADGGDDPVAGDAGQQVLHDGMAELAGGTGDDDHGTLPMR
jgi:hypothetical protein